MQALSTLFAPRRCPNLKWLFQAVAAGRGAVRQIEVKSLYFFHGSCKFFDAKQRGNPCFIIVGSDADPKMWFFLEMSI